MLPADAVSLGILRTLCVSIGGATGGTACEDEESSAVRRNIPSSHLATGRMEFTPIFQPGMDNHISLVPFSKDLDRSLNIDQTSKPASNSTKLHIKRNLGFLIPH